MQNKVDVWSRSIDIIKTVVLNRCLEGVLYGHHTESIDLPGKVANPARGQLNREKCLPGGKFEETWLRGIPG